jgi:hypothetical protein
MASGKKSPDETTDAAVPVTQHIGDLYTTDLTSAERRSLARSRKVAFCVLAACAVLAIGGAVYFWYLWFLTAKTCIDIYILEPADSFINRLKLARSWQSKLIRLDISSFSALILALLFTRLAYVGCRNTLQYFRRDGWSYFGRAYHSVLFTDGFETLCIRFGLLGTLLSFLLAAVAQLASASVTPSTAGRQSLGDKVATVAQESAGGPGDVLSEPDVNKNTSGTEELSTDIFLLLCASLVSTFVGTGVAYVVTPSLNWINERALGLHQLGQADTKFAAEEFFRQVTRTSRRLAEFETTTVTLAKAADGISRFDANVAKTAQSLGDLIAGFEVRMDTATRALTELINGLQRAIQTFDVSTQTGKQLSRKLDQLEAMSDRVSALLDRLPERLNDPLKNMSLTAGKFREAALSGESAFRELKEVAGTARESLSETTHRTHATWQMLRELQDGLKEMARNEEAQTTEISKLAEAFDTIGVSLSAIVRELDLPGTRLRQHDGEDPEAAGAIAVHRTRLRETNAGRPGDDGRGTARPSHARPVDAPDGPRPWWRRIFE